MCAGCNRRHNVDPAPYLSYMLDRYGPEVVAELDRLRTAALGERTPDVPVVFYTTAAYEADREAGSGAGAAAYVVKPTIGELVEAVRRLLG